MTLVFTFITSDYSIVVSDRRLVTESGKLYDDDTNKIVLLDCCSVFAYTGLARINGQSTHHWLAETISKPQPRTIAGVLPEIRTKATDAFHRMNLPSVLKRHAFVGVGWVNLQPANILRPCLFRISNFHDQSGRTLEDANDEFIGHLLVLGPKQWFACQWSGQQLAPNSRVWLNRMITRAGRERLNPNLIWRLISSLIRNTASSNSYVGAGVLGACIPRVAVPPTEFQIVSPLTAPYRFDAYTPSFLEMPSRSAKCVVHGPTMVLPGVIVDAPKLIELGPAEN